MHALVEQEAQRTPHPTRLRRPTFSLKGRRGAQGSFAAKTQRLARGAPFSPGGRRVGDEGAQPVDNQPAFASLLSQRPPHPTASRPPSSTREEGSSGQRFGRTSSTRQKSPSPLVRGEGRGEGCAACRCQPAFANLLPQHTPHPTRLRRPTFSLKGRREAESGSVSELPQ